MHDFVLQRLQGILRVFYYWLLMHIPSQKPCNLVCVHTQVPCHKSSVLDVAKYAVSNIKVHEANLTIKKGIQAVSRPKISSQWASRFLLINC